MEEEANIIEQQMAVQHRLDNQATTQTGGKFEGNLIQIQIKSDYNLFFW